MRVIRGWVVCVGIAWAGVAPAAPKAGAAAPPKVSAPAAPKVSAQALYKAAAAAYGNGDYPQALSLIDQGLAVAPKDLDLLWLKATLLLELRKYPEALAAFESLLAAGVKGARRREAEAIAQKLRAVRTTSLEITITNGPATVYLDSMALGVFCPPSPSCKQAVLPNVYTVIAERPGFKRKSVPVTVASGQPKSLSITLDEEPSPLTVQVAPAEARVAVDGAPYDPAAKLAAGPHEIVVALDGHAEERRQVVAQLGKPIQLDVALMPLVPVHVAPAGTVLRLGGKPVAPQDGRIPLPPGAHRLVASSPGYDERRIEIPAERGPDYEIVVKLDRHVAPRPPPSAPRRPITVRRKLAAAAGGVAFVALGAGVGFGVHARRLDDEAYALCPSPSEPCASAAAATDLNEQARTRALQANIAYGVVGAAAVAGAILWLTGGGERARGAALERATARRERVSLTPRLGAVSSLDLAVRF